MNSQDKKNNRLANGIARACGLLTACFAIAALLGWAADIPLLTTFGSGIIPMAPSTALLFVLYGIAVFLHPLSPNNRTMQRIVISIISISLLAGLLLLLLSSFNITLEAEHLGFGISGELNGAPIGHMSPLTAACFVLAGISFLLLCSSIKDRSWDTTTALLSAYIILLIAMILTMAYLLGGRLLYNTGVIPPALTTSLAFLALGAGLVVHSGQRLRQGNLHSDATGKYFPYMLILIFIFFSTGIVTGGYFYFRDSKDNYETAYKARLSAIAEQKSDEIVQWRKERVGDASVFYKNEFFSSLVRQYIKRRHSPDAGKRLKAWLEKVQTAYDYDRVFLLDAHGGLLLSAPESAEPVELHLVGDVSEVMVSKKITFLDFHRDAVDSTIHLAVIVPIIDDRDAGVPLGVLVLRINPETYLYPLIQRWPTPSNTAETLLVRREGNEVLYLNELRFRKGSALKLRFPLNRTELPAVQAALGHEGIVEGRDYRGLPVIAGLKAIPDSPWYIVARMDTSEIASPLGERMRMIIILIGILLAGAGIGIGLIWRQQRLQLYKERYKALEAAKAAEIHYQDTLDKMMEGCQTLGFDWRYLYINDSAAKQGKASKKEMLGRTMMEQYPGIENTETFAVLKRSMEDRTSWTIENEFLYPDGDKGFFQLSIQPVPDGIFILSMDITERKRAEDALRESEHRLSSIFDTVGDVIYYLAVEADNSYRFISVNHAFCNVTGLNEEMVVGKLVNEVIPEPSLSMVLEKYRQAIKENSIIRWEETSDYPTGRLIGDVSIAPVVDDKGRCAYLVGSVHDITERKRAEERERHLNATLRAIRNVNQLITKEKDRDRLIQGACENLVTERGFNSSWIVSLDESGMPVYLSESGLKKSSLALKEIFDRGELPPCAKTALARPGIVIVNDVLDQCAGCPLSSGYKRNAAFCVRLEKAGKIYGILCASVPHSFADDFQEQSLFQEIGEDIAFALYNIELEERREKMEKELKDSEARYRTLFESAAEGMLIVETQTKKFKYANPAMCQMLGYTEDELKRLTIRDIHPDDVIERVFSEFELYEQEGKLMTQQDIACLKKDGTIIYTDVVTTSRISIDGSLHSASFFIDITERKKAEVDKKKLEEQLWQSQKMEAIGRLSGGIAHDFNNMLTTIIGNADMALMEIGREDPLKEVIEDIKLAGEKAAVLTRQILAFSRRQILQTEIFNLNDIVSEMDKMLRRLIGEDIELETILSPDLGQVETDPGQVEQIIMNLAVNARDAMPEGGKLTIETASVELDEKYAASHFPVIPGHYEMISISDTGIGMSKEIYSQIFEPFFTTKPKGKGTGLGLSIVYGIIKQSNGYIWVYSEPGNGATFKIYLPRVEKSSHDQAETDKRPQELFRGSETIMVVEDDAMIMKMIIKALNSCGYAVLCAADGNEALRVSEGHEGPIHLVLTDVIMPGMGGREMANRLEETRPETKILYMSGYTDNAIVHHGVLDKGLSFIQKPFTSNNLMKKVREALGN